jgi:hypothetical protein
MCSTRRSRDERDIICGMGSKGAARDSDSSGVDERASAQPTSAKANEQTIKPRIRPPVMLHPSPLIATDKLESGRATPPYATARLDGCQRSA